MTFRLLVAVVVPVAFFAGCDGFISEVEPPTLPVFPDRPTLTETQVIEEGPVVFRGRSYPVVREITTDQATGDVISDQRYALVDDREVRCGSDCFLSVQRYLANQESGGSEY